MPARRLAIIGAGVAGLGAAYALRQAGAGAETVVFEKSRGLGGRVTTRRRHGARYDHGAQYAKPPPGSTVHTLLAEVLPAEALIDVERPVWPFDASGTLRPGAARADGAPKWSYTPGLSHLGTLLAEATPDLEVRTQTRIAQLTGEGDGWRLQDEDGRDHGRFDRVLLTPPAPQSADLLGASTGPASLKGVEAALRAVPYRSQFALVFGFEGAVARPESDGVMPYGLVDTSGQFPAAWLAFESDKPGHAPPGQTVVIAQMSPAWTDTHYHLERDALPRAAWPHLVMLLGADPGPPLWTDRQRWRYALPDGALAPGALKAAQAIGLDLAGDFISGEGRVHLALEAGLDAGARLADALAA